MGYAIALWRKNILYLWLSEGKDLAGNKNDSRDTSSYLLGACAIAAPPLLLSPGI